MGVSRRMELEDGVLDLAIDPRAGAVLSRFGTCGEDFRKGAVECGFKPLAPECLAQRL
jgi:hypothetical protein